MGEAAAEAGKNYDDSDSVYGKTLPTEDTVTNRKDDMDKHASEYTDGQTKELWNAYESVSQFELSGILFFGTDLTSIYKGQANVIFENSKSGELRVADYDLSLTLKAGLEFNIIASLSHTTYSRLVKKSEHTDEFFQSFEDNFASVGKSFNYGLFNLGGQATTSVNSKGQLDFGKEAWTGGGFFVGLVISKGGSMSIINYTLVEDSVQTFQPGTWYKDFNGKIQPIPEEALRRGR